MASSRLLLFCITLIRFYLLLLFLFLIESFSASFLYFVSTTAYRN